MKARVKATKEIVSIEKNVGYPGGYVASNGKTYHGEELEVIVNCDPDYWTRLEHQYAGMAMQGLCMNDYCDCVGADDIATDALTIAHALVQKLKEKEERK